MAEAISLAKELNHMHALAVALCFAGFLGQFERNPADVERWTSDLIELSNASTLHFGCTQARLSAAGRAALPATRLKASRGLRKG